MSITRKRRPDVTLPASTVAALRREAELRGVGYTTLLRQIIAERLVTQDQQPLPPAPSAADPMQRVPLVVPEELLQTLQETATRLGYKSAGALVRTLLAVWEIQRNQPAGYRPARVDRERLLEEWLRTDRPAAEAALAQAVTDVLPYSALLAVPLEATDDSDLAHEVNLLADTVGGNSDLTCGWLAAGRPELAAFLHRVARALARALRVRALEEQMPPELEDEP